MAIQQNFVTCFHNADNPTRPEDVHAFAIMAIWSSVAWKLCDITFVKLQGIMYG